jgi:hypothetical protein
MSDDHIHPLGHLIAMGSGAAAGLVVWGVFAAGGKSGVAIFLGLIAGAIAYTVAFAIVSKSPSYGEKCRFCPARGKITDRRLEKNFSRTIERKGVKYNQYTVTYLRTCQICGKEWPSVRQEEDSNFLGEINNALEGFTKGL